MAHAQAKQAKQAAQLIELAEKRRVHWEGHTAKASAMSIKRATYLDCKYLHKDISGYFRHVKTLASGSNGKVTKAQTLPAARTYIGDDLPDYVAIKIMNMPEVEPAKQILRDELAILKSIDMPQVSKYYGCFTTLTDVYLVMELVPGRDLFYTVFEPFPGKELTAADKYRITYLMAQAIAELHAQGIVHRDIKVENVMVIFNDDDKGEGRVSIKLVDFGFSCSEKNMATYSCTKRDMGTLAFFDPYLPRFPNMDDLKSADWWAFAKTIYLMYTQEQLYDDNPRLRLEPMSPERHIDPDSDKMRAVMPKKIKHMLKRVLSKKYRPPKRYTAAQIIEDIEAARL